MNKANHQTPDADVVPVDGEAGNHICQSRDRGRGMKKPRFHADVNPP